MGAKHKPGAGRDREDVRPLVTLAPVNASSLIPRWLYLVFAWAMLTLGLIGIVVPGLPTTPFVLLAAWAAARGSTRLHRWLLAHQTFGPLIRDWQASGAVSRRAKWAAILTMALCAVIMCLTAPRWWMAATGSAVLLITGTWLWLRPEPASAPTSDSAPPTQT